jgi:hypothetical protein
VTCVGKFCLHTMNSTWHGLAGAAAVSCNYVRHWGWLGQRWCVLHSE